MQEVTVRLIPAISWPETTFLLIHKVWHDIAHNRAPCASPNAHRCIVPRPAKIFLCQELESHQFEGIDQLHLHFRVVEAFRREAVIVV